MRRIKLTVAYDGTAYAGWQLQPGQPTVEAKLNRALSAITGEEIKVIGASRTDAGVHALGNVAVFDTDCSIPAEKICFAVNSRLPEDIRVQSSCEVPMDFHPRKVNSRKSYEYKILNRRIALPRERLYSHHVYQALNIEDMQAAATYLVGEHNFKSFCSVHTQVLDTVRTIYELQVLQQGAIITVSITGSGFLYNMVRIITGTLLEVGHGAYPPEKVIEMLDGCNRSLAGPTAPAKGLTLVEIRY